MEKKVYLSIDIDFWYSATVAKNQLTNIFDSLPKGISKIAVMNHQQMEKFVSKSDANILINIDTHSDFVDRRVTEFNCGTWTAYVSWRKESISGTVVTKVLRLDAAIRW